LQGVLNQLSLYIPGLHAAEYTTLWRRIRATPFEREQREPQNEESQESEDGDIIAAIDATGMKVTNRGEWMKEN